MPHSEFLLAVLDSLPDERRAAVERELTITARRAAAGELAADVAHDAGNSLFAILGLVDLLLADTEPGSKAAEQLELIRQTGLSLRDDLRLLVDFARDEPEQSRTAVFEDAVRAAWNLVRQGTGGQLELVARCPHEPLVVACEAGALRQAALHLLAAARAGAGTSRLIEVDVARETPETALLRVRPAGADGLGIAIARRIAADHDGSLQRGPEALLLRFPLAL